MTCKDIQDLLPEILLEPGKHPEAEAHLHICEDCQSELAFLQELREGIRVTMPDPTITETLGQRIRVSRQLRREQLKRPLIYAAAMAAVLTLSLLLPGVFPQNNEPQFFANYEEETQSTLMSLDLDEGMQISTDEIAMYLLENADIETIKELGLENYQVKI